MTALESRMIIDLRRKGYSYAEISAATNVAISTIKSFIKNYKANEDDTVCKCCKISLTQPEKAGRRKEFCSDSCRMQWWNEHRDIVYKKPPKPKVCLYCGQKFIVQYRKNQKYCNRTCYLNHVKKEAKYE